MKEKKLVEEIIKGNQKAISRFYKTYQKRLLAYIKKKTPSFKDAEEILQDSFVSALDSLPLFKFQSNLYTWLCSITRHEIADFYRRKKLKTIVFSRFPFLKKLVDQALSPELALQEKEFKEKIGLTFKNLSEGYSRILRLKYIEGLSYKEIAQKLGKTVKAVESKLFRARMAFQKEYVKESKSLGKNWPVFTSPPDQGELPF